MLEDRGRGPQQGPHAPDTPAAVILRRCRTGTLRARHGPLGRHGRQIPGMDHAQHFVPVRVQHRQPGREALAGKTAGRGIVGLAVQPAHPVARGHDEAGRASAQADHAGHHVALFRLEQGLGIALAGQGRGIAPRFFLAGTSAAQQPQHRHGHGFTHVAHADALAAVAQGHLVADLHQHREADGRIEIALGDMVAQTVHEQAQADHHQKAQTQDDDRGVTLHKTCQRRGGHDHDQHGHDDGQHHHRDMVHHAHRGDDGIQGEHGIQHQDLDDDLPEARARGRRGVFGHAAFQALVQLHGPLEQQKDAAAHEDEISPREGFAEDRDQGLGQTDDPGDGGNQHQARDERQTKTGEEGPAALFLRMQARGEDGDENEVVDAQHDLEHDQGAQPGPGRGIGDPREIPHGSFPPPCGSDAEVMPGPPAPHGVPDWMEAAYAGVRQESVGMAGKRAKKKEGPEPLLGSLWRTAYSAASWMRLKPATLMSPPAALATSRTTSVMLFLSSRM